MSGESFSRLGFHVGADWQVRCSTYDDRTPIFDIDAGTVVGRHLAPGGRPPTRTRSEFARALAEGARKFADEVERMHAARRRHRRHRQGRWKRCGLNEH